MAAFVVLNVPASLRARNRAPEASNPDARIDSRHRSTHEETMIKVGIVGGTGYTGVELLRLLAQHPEADVRAITSRKDAGTKVADMFPSLRGKYSLAFVDPADAASRRVRRRVLRDAAWRRDGAGSRARGRRRADHRPRRGFPPQGPGGLRAMVWHAARVPGSARRIGLRVARGESRRHQGRPHRRQSGLLSDRRAAWLPASARGRNRRRRASRRRLQVRSVRRRPQGRDGLAVRGGVRQLQGLQRQGPSAPSGNCPGPATPPPGHRSASSSRRISCR